MASPSGASTVVIGRFRFNKRHCLGEGSFGKVYEGEDITTHEKVAIKAINAEIFNRDGYYKSAFEDEIAILKRFNHPNIVQFKDVIGWKNHSSFSADETVYVIMEFCGDGDLKDFMKKNSNLTEEQSVGIFK